MQSNVPAADVNLFRSFWDDGLLDLLAGLALLVAGVGWLTPIGPLAVLQAPLWTVFWAPLRRRLVEPRAGYVRFAQARRVRNTHNLLLTTALGVLLLAAVLLASRWARGTDAAAFGDLAAAIPAAIVATMAMLAALLTGARRFAGYAALLLLSGALAARLGLEPAVPLAATGLVAALAGAGLLTRFIRDSRDYLERT